jgi:hypothetical protein
MFALSRLHERIVWIAAVGLLLVGGGAILETRGYARCVRQDAIAKQTQDVHNAQMAGRNSAIIQQEAETYAADIARPVDRPVTIRVCAPAHHSREVSATSAARPQSDASPPDGGEDQAAALRAVTAGPELQALAKNADAQILALQDYIARVCLAR